MAGRDTSFFEGFPAFFQFGYCHVRSGRLKFKSDRNSHFLTEMPEKEEREMLICPNCGTANTDDSKFCENCGTKLEGEAQYVPEETGETKVEPAAEPENAPNMESDEEPTAGPEQAAEPEEEQVESAERPEEQVPAFDQPVEPEAQPEPEP